MAKNCLIYETLNSTEQLQHHKSEDGLMHLKGVFGVCGVRNNNSRIYEHDNYAKMVADMKKRIEESKGIAGELEHPATMNITLENISHKIVDINIDENGVVSGEIALLDTPKGQVAQKIVEGGLPLFISSRAQGSVDQRTGVVTLESLATYDLVGSPGFSQAKLHLNENQVAESINESNAFYIVDKNQLNEGQDQNQNNQNADMDKELQDKFEALEQRLATLEEENTNLKEQVAAFENIDVERLANSIQGWIINECAPEIQKWIFEEASTELTAGLVTENEGMNPERLEKLANGIQKWILEDYSQTVQKWVINEFAQSVQKWILEELTPTMESWITENTISKEEMSKRIEESVNQFKDDKFSQIKETLSLLEGMDVKKPTYQRSNTQTKKDVNEGMPKYIAEMPDDVRVKYELASQEIREAIDRRARLCDFTNEGAVVEFWNKIDFDSIKPSKNIYEGLDNIQDEREREIRAQFRRFRMNH